MFLYTFIVNETNVLIEVRVYEIIQKKKKLESMVGFFIFIFLLNAKYNTTFVMKELNKIKYLIS